MAPGKVAADFNEMINKNRQKRKNEALAEQIFSKNRRASAPGAGVASRKPTAVPSLASRIGVGKRNLSTSMKNPKKPAARPSAGNVNAEWTHDLHSLNNVPGPNVPRGPKAGRANRKELLSSVLNGSASSPALNSQFNIMGASKPGISIRGVAGPYIVVAKNLAPGTTVADIESATAQFGGAVLACKIITEKPKVIAEVEFETREGAENVVDTLNNQNADGNILHVYHKIGAVKSIRSTPSTPQGPRADLINEDTRSAYAGSDRYTPRERRQNDREDIMDGSYGFDNRMETDDDNYSNGRDRGSLYSDNIVGNRGRGGGDNQDRRDRGRGNGYR
ncbi:RNA-binding, RBD [Venustampulla echinocandica]|uniref:RNA-binding, RBD n=1 Tax=Venustampulla echinocandica TaxID=2656787 RepID=A0A370TIQ2_9HELO|nr:RNA-binding, RBD [Venustampulla echinocandica]RDL35236.1 RNA-binding, RBD [Venustampulla echinocandica]